MVTNHLVPADTEQLLLLAYDLFNRRDSDAALAGMTADVDWPNGMEGGYVHGHDAVRDYWTRQWGIIDPRVEPQGMVLEDDGRVAVTVLQVVRDLAGTVLTERIVVHLYRLREGLVAHMEIRED